MPRNLRRYQKTRELHFLTFSCYRRQPLLRLARARDLFLDVLEKARRRFGFVVVGYVVMPERVHLLLSEPEAGSLATALQVLKQESSRRLRESRSADPRQPEFFPASLDSRFWQRRYYDFASRSCATCTATRMGSGYHSSRAAPCVARRFRALGFARSSRES